MEKERVFYLDFIRSLSILLIVGFHFNSSLVRNSITGPEILFRLYSNGNLARIGVSLFLIISGAALMYTYREEFLFKKFFKKRFYSIYPMFWTAYAFAFLYLFFINRTIFNHVPNWNFIFTILGMDGYLSSWKIPTFYILGEWFLGLIIILYFLFPLLRKVLIKNPKILILFVSIVYVVVVENYNFTIGQELNILTRIPEFLFGMYFMLNVKRLTIYHFMGAVCISFVMLFITLNIHQMYKITITGISIFIILAYIGQYIKQKIFKDLIIVISKYSYAAFLVHHVIIKKILTGFNGRHISVPESLCLFVITCIVIITASVILHNLTNMGLAAITGYKKERVVE